MGPSHAELSKWMILTYAMVNSKGMLRIAKMTVAVRHLGVHRPFPNRLGPQDVNHVSVLMNV